MSAAGPRWSWLPLAAPFVVAVVALAAWQSLVMLYRIPAYLVPSPVLVARTPYGRDMLQSGLLSAPPADVVRAGYVVVYQDSRGRF